MHRLDILFEDNHLLVVNKPPELATMGSESLPTVHSLAVDYLRRKYHKPGRVYLGIVSRLDAMTSGVLVLARTSKAASRLVPQFAAKDGSGAIKLYLAIIEGQLGAESGRWDDSLLKDDAARRMRVVDSNEPGAQAASLSFLRVARWKNRSLVAIQLLSGRKHQIRVQFSDRGHPLLGDRKYGAKSAWASGVALHSWRLKIVHPTHRKEMWFEAALPQSWRSGGTMIPEARQLTDRINEHFKLTRDSQV